ncbi:MAG: cytosine permease [Thermoplasmatales archaeon]|jgi:cytosine permease|nr:cytosine permease [Candidatus Thermoplasmatota archaeon]MDA8055382.1 cytosine permease [Thermoplasmatales archaeon]
MEKNVPKQKISQVVDDYSLRKVPEGSRRGFFNMFMVLNASFAAIAVVWGGGALGYGLTFIGAVIAVFAASTILAVIGSLTGYMSAKSGGSTYLNWRYAFGRIPSGIFGVALIMITTGIGWYAVETWLFGIVMSEMFTTGLLHNIVFDSLWGGALMVLATYIGYRALSFLTYVALPQHIWLIGVGFFIALALVPGGAGHLISLKPTAPYSITAGITAAVGLYIAGGLIAGDLTRFAKNGRIAWVSWTVHMYAIYPFLILGGVALVLVTGTYLVTQAMLDVGMGIAVLLIIVLGQLCINAVNLYSGSLSLVNLWKMNRGTASIINGVIGIGIAAWIGYTSGASITPFENFITLLGDFLPAAAGVVIADFYIVHRYLKGERKMEERYNFTSTGKYPEVNVAGIISFGIGAAVGLFVHIGIAAVNAFLVGIVAYLIITFVAKAIKVRYEFGVYEHKRLMLKAGEIQDLSADAPHSPGGK